MGYNAEDVRFAAEIYRLTEGKEHSVSISRAAESCSMSAYGARHAAQRLALEGLALLERYGEISLSESGMRAARRRLENLSSARRLLAWVGICDDCVSERLSDVLPDSFFKAFEQKLASLGEAGAFTDAPEGQNSPKLLQLRPK